MTFTDYPADKIAAKLKQAQDFEAKYGANDTSKAWIKWCKDYEYRKREWLWRQKLAAANEELHNKIYHEERFI
mgnify:CR=1 FL=1